MSAWTAVRVCAFGALAVVWTVRFIGVLFYGAALDLGSQVVAAFGCALWFGDCCWDAVEDGRDARRRDARRVRR